MSEVSRTNLPPAEPVKEDEMDDRGHGDKLENAVDRVVEGEQTPGKEAERLKGDEVME